MNLERAESPKTMSQKVVEWALFVKTSGHRTKTGGDRTLAQKHSTGGDRTLAQNIAVKILINHRTT